MLKQKLQIMGLIQENDAAYLKYENTELEYKLVNSILQEAMQLFEDEGDGHFKRNWGKYAAGLGVGGVLANGGTFGAGAQHATHSMLNAAKNIGHTAFDKASDGLDKSANYYSHGLSKLDPKSEGTPSGTGATSGSNHSSYGDNGNNGINPTPNYYGNDGATINPDTAHRFSEDYSYRLGDAAEHAVHTGFERAPGIVGGAAVGAGLGAAIGKKFGHSKLGMKVGSGLGGLAGGTLPYLKGAVEDPAIGTMHLG